MAESDGANQQPKTPSTSQPAQSVSEGLQKHLTAGFWFIAALALFDWWLRYMNGYGINGYVLLVDVLLLVVFGANFSWAASWAIFFCGLVLPELMIATNATFSLGIFVFPDIVLYWPIWLIVLLIYKISFDPESSFSKYAVVAALVVGLFFAWPSLTNAYHDSSYRVNTAALGQFSEGVSSATKDSVTSLQVSFCKLTTQDEKGCQEKYGIIADEAELSSVKVDEVLNTGFNIRISQFSDTSLTLFGDTVAPAVTIQAQNGFEKAPVVNIACGFEGEEAGIATPNNFELKQTSTPEETVIECSIPSPKSKSPTFIFNATTSHVQSSGYKEILVTGDSNLNGVLSDVKLTQRSPVLSINEALSKSKAFGDYLSQAKNSLNPQVGKDDVVQVVIKDRRSQFTAPVQLIYGVADSSTIPFTVFLKNSGTGFITAINDVQVTLPDQLQFSKTDCVKKSQRLKAGPDAIIPVAGCDLIFKGNLAQPNQITPKTISVLVDYDYTLQRKQEISIS